MILFQIFLSLSLAASNSCDESLLILSPLLKSTVKPMELDVIPKDLSPLQVLFRGTLHSVEPAEFSEIFKIVSKRDLKKLFEAVDNGAIKVSKLEAERLGALREFVTNDKYDVLWDKSSDALSSLTTKYPSYRGPGYKDQLGGVIAGRDTYAMTKLEAEIIDAGLGKPSRIGKGSVLKRFLAPAYTSVETILRQNNLVRGLLHYSQEFVDAVTDTVTKHKSLLSREESDEMAGLIRKIEGHEKAEILGMEKIYGQDIFTGGAQAHTELDIYKMSKRIKEAKLGGKPLDTEVLVESAEQAIFRMEEIINQARVRAKKQPLALVDHHLSDLRYRHGYHDKSVRRAMRSRSNALSNTIDDTVHVDYEWTELVAKQRTVTDANGKPMTETYFVSETRYGSENVAPSFDEVLHDRLSAYSVGNSFQQGHITSVSGKSTILSESAKMSKIEDNLLQIVSAADGKLNALTQSHKQFLLKNKKSQEALVAQVKLARDVADDMRKTAKQIDAHLALSKSQVAKIWPKDEYKVFKKRNEELKRWAIEASEQLEVYAAQVANKDFVLTVTPDLPNYSAELGKLRRKMYVNYGIKGAGVGGGLSYGMCEFIKFSGRDDYRHAERQQTSCLTDLKNTVNDAWDGLFAN